MIVHRQLEQSGLNLHADISPVAKVKKELHCFRLAEIFMG